MTELSIKSNNPGETSRGWMWDCAFSGDSQYIVTGEARGLIWLSPGPALAQDLAVSPAGALPGPRAPVCEERAPSLAPSTRAAASLEHFAGAAAGRLSGLQR